MERLTFRDEEMCCDCPVREEDDIVRQFCDRVCDEFQMNCPYMKMGQKLKIYEDAEEQGLLHKAPLKNGTLIWFFQYGFDEGPYLTSGIYLYGVTEYEIGEFKKDFWLSEEDALSANEEAEKALEEMKGGAV